MLGEALRTWVGDRGMQYDKAVIVDREEHGEGRDIVTLLERNGIHTSTSPAGRQLLAGPLDGVDLPAVRLWDGRVLGRPGRSELAATLGGNTRPRRDHYDVASYRRAKWFQFALMEP